MVKLENLTQAQGRYLLEIKGFLVCHTSRDNPNYNIAEQLEKLKLITIVGSGPLRRTALTELGESYVRELQGT